MKTTMNRFLLGILMVAAMTEVALIATPRAQARREPQVGVCKDPWMNQVFKDIIKRAPQVTKKECQPDYYGTDEGKGIWTGLDDLANKMMVKLTGKGAVYIFDAEHAVANQGHVGCAIVQSNGRYLITITENSKSSYHIGKGDDNGHFEQVVNTEKEMFEVIRGRYSKDWDKYKEYKRVYVANATIDGGIATAKATRTMGYDGLGNNCADHTMAIIRAYGVPMTVLSTLQRRPSPNSWFRAIGWIDYNGGAHPQGNLPGIKIPS